MMSASFVSRKIIIIAGIREVGIRGQESGIRNRKNIISREGTKREESALFFKDPASGREELFLRAFA
jgi:hypothetical protein